MKMKKVYLINVLKGMITGVVSIICLLTISQDLTAQTIQFNGGSCVLDTIVKGSGFARADFTYSLDENAKIFALLVLVEKGQLVTNKNKVADCSEEHLYGKIPANSAK